MAALTAQLTTIVRELSAWVQAEPRTLADVEQQTLARVKALGTALLTGVVQLSACRAPAPTVACACGHAAAFARWRLAQVRTVLGPITLRRPYYYCAHCHHGTIPLDHQLGIVAGSTSAGLDELLALLGAQEESFAQAAHVLDKLTLVHVCPNLVRAATERLGQALIAAEEATVTATWAGELPAPPAQPPERLYVSLDGVLLPTADGWKECKLGAVYTTVAEPRPAQPTAPVLRAQQASYVAAVQPPDAFGRLLWCEAARRGVDQAPTVVAIGDGAHWIWNLVAEHFPDAIQIVDWYHAVQYLWAAAVAIYGEGTDLARQWAHDRQADLWQGDIAAVLAALEAQREGGDAVAAAISYVTNNRHRMDYPRYRAQGFQIGSGLIESGCRHVIGLRLKQPGMCWQVAGAEAVATVRTWLKSGRWQEAMTLRPPRQRSYQRHAA
ncbi:MAG TPA: ISKra4 family transposase [Thermomicrobiales bacterium]|nr:ISKra4 family transposase [Thermomicrobiales bacterium]